jgi:L-lactate dehydrogenase (cytochrome)
MSICSIEDVRAAVEGTFWFQLYLMRDRGFNAALISRAREARCPRSCSRSICHCSLRGAIPRMGFPPPRLTTAMPGKSHMPTLAWGRVVRARRTLGNLASFFPERGIGELSEWVGGQFDPSINWKDVVGSVNAGRASSSSRGYSTPGCAAGGRCRR